VLVTSSTEQYYKTIQNLVNGYAGLTFTGSRSNSLDTALKLLNRRHPQLNELGLLSLICEDPQILADLTDLLLVHETYFFREPDLLKRFIDLVSKQQTKETNSRGELKIWCAGCSTGEEAYSLAILLDERLPGLDYRILATDLSLSALRKAEEGRYSQWSLRGLDEATKKKYFVRSENSYSIKNASLRERITFAQMNLKQVTSLTPEWTPLDAIVCRNVLIYFEKPCIGRLSKLFFDHLDLNGFCLTASSDPPLAPNSGFSINAGNCGIVYTKATPANLTHTINHQPNILAKSVHRKRPEEILKATEKKPVDEAREIATTNGGNYLKALEVYKNGDCKTAIQLLSSSTNKNDKKVLTALNLRYISHTGKRNDIEAFLEGLMQKSPCEEDELVVGALACIELKVLRRAEVLLRKAVYLDRKSSYTHHLLGVVSFKNGDLTSARKAFCNAQKIADGQTVLEPIANIEYTDQARFCLDIERYLCLIGEKNNNE